MVSANLRYRNHRPYGYFAIPTSNLHFNGDKDLTGLLSRLSRLIQFDKYDEYKIQIEKLREYKQANLTEWLEWQREIKTLKKEHLFWMLSKELREEMAILQDECNRLATNDECLGLEISELEDSQFYTPFELTTKFKGLLAELGFTCKAATNNDSNLHEEIYESTCSDEELKTRAENRITELEKVKEERKSELIEQYSPFEISSTETPEEISTM